MSLADTFRDNAADCSFLAERSEDAETKLAFKKMEAAWRTLADQQDQLYHVSLIRTHVPTGVIRLT
jgi:hypothetical protein